MKKPLYSPIGLWKKFSLTAVAAAIGAIPLQADNYSQNFDEFDDGDIEFGDGSELVTTGVEAGVADGALKLTDDLEGSTNTGFFMPGLGAEAGSDFKVQFLYSLFDEEGGNPPADGFSFNMGPFTSGDTGSEEGFGSGLSVEFDTWDNGGGENGHSIAVDNVDAIDGVLSKLPFVDDEFHWVEIIYKNVDDNGGTLTMRVDDVTFFDEIAIDYVPHPDDITAFAARTGGATETLLVDDLDFTAPAVLRDPRISSDSALSFGLVGVGTNHMATFPINNEGATNDLVISEAEITGTNSASFSIDTALPVTIAPGESALLTINFAAGAEVGPKNAVLELTNNDSAERAQLKEIDLSGLVIDGGAGIACYRQDFDGFDDETTDLEDDSVMFSTTDTAFVVDNALQLTDDAVGSTNAGFITPSLGDPATLGWKATFDMLLFDEEGGNPPADGVSFNWGLIEDGASGSEEGYGTGLSVEFDTWNNGAGEAGHNVAVEGVDAPDGYIPEVPLVDGEFHRYEITWLRNGEDSGTITVLRDGEPLFEDIETPDLIPEEDWTFAYAARTGGATETVLIDNLIIYAPPPMVYEQDFNGFDNGTTDLADGSTLQSTPAGVNSVQDNALRLTDDATGSTSAAYYIPSLGDTQVKGFSADFNFMLFDAEGGNPPADGFSFNFGAINPGDAGSEEGFGTGLSIEFDTWNNTDGEAGFNVAVDNVDVEGGFVNMPSVPVDGQFHKARIEYNYIDEEGTISLLIDGETIFDNLAVPGFEPTGALNYAFAGRTGGATETVLIDDLLISAPPAPPRPGDDPLIDSVGTLNFGAVVGSGSEMLTVNNLGATKDLIIESSEITGADAAAFSLATALPVTIPPGGSTDLQIDVTVPAEPGTLEAQITLTNNDARERAREWPVNLIAAASVPGRDYAQNFDGFDDDTTDLGDGSVISSNDDVARVIDDSLTLTQDEQGSSSAAFKTPVMGDLSGGWTATFDLAMFAGIGQNPADGFSFNFGEIPEDPNNREGEEGWTSALVVSFDTWDNGGEGADTGVGLDIKVGGVVVEPDDGLLREDFFENDDGFYENAFLIMDGEFRPVVITWEPGGAGGFISVSIDGVQHFDRLELPEFCAASKLPLRLRGTDWWCP